MQVKKLVALEAIGIYQQVLVQTHYFSQKKEKNKVNTMTSAIYHYALREAKEVQDKRARETVRQNKEHNCWFPIILTTPIFLP